MARRREIAELISREGVVRVDELSAKFGVSEVTIRNDLEIMAKEGLLIRDRGGAIANLRTNLAVAFEQRAAANQAVKRRIGQAAARMVQPGETIILDAGTTLTEMAAALGAIAPLTVVTNAVNIALLVGALPDVLVVMAGGSLSRQTISTVGPLA